MCACDVLNIIIKVYVLLRDWLLILGDTRFLLLSREGMALGVKVPIYSGHLVCSLRVSSPKITIWLVPCGYAPENNHYFTGACNEYGRGFVDLYRVIPLDDFES